MRFVLLLAIVSAAQGTDQTGTLTGTVIDAVTRLPIIKATVNVEFMGNIGIQAPSAAATDATGAFTISNVSPGRYRLTFQHQNYPRGGGGAVTKTVEVRVGESNSPVKVELIPGASITGRVVDEDGDALSGCNIQIHFVNSPDDLVPMLGPASSNDGGGYRAYGIAAGKYIVSAQCHQAVFQPRPLSSGPDPPPTRAYPLQWYPMALDQKSAQVVELTAGAEKSGIDFQMKPVAITRIRGIISPGSADWHGTPVNLLLSSLDNPGQSVRVLLDQAKNNFEFRMVFPGSYNLIAWANGGEDNRIGGWQRIEVGNEPLNVTFVLKRGTTIRGKVEIEGRAPPTSPVISGQIRVMLYNNGMVIGAPPRDAQVNGDGTFTLKGVVPGLWHLQASAPNTFLKAVWLGSADVTNTSADFSTGGDLRIVLSTDTATIRGSAPPGDSVVLLESGDRGRLQGTRGAPVDQSGQYEFKGLGPGNYWIQVNDGSGGFVTNERSFEVNLKEGETAVVDLKPPDPQ